MDDARLAQIEARLVEATRGPWTWDGRRVPTLEGRGGDPETYEYAVDVLIADHSGECGCRSACELELAVSYADAQLIANAPTDLADLVAEVRRLREEQKVLQNALLGDLDD